MNSDRPTFQILCLANFILAVGNTGVLSLMPAIGRAFQLSDTSVASVFAGSTLLWALFAPGWGRLSDRIGRRPVMIIGLTGFTVSLAGFGLAASLGLALLLPPLLAFCLMGLARTLHGAVASAAPVALQAHVADNTPPSQRVRRLSYLASAQGLGFVAGPAIAPLLIFSALGLAGPIYAFCIAGLCALLLVAAKLREGSLAPRPPKSRPASGVPSLWLDRRIRPFFVYGLLLTSVQAMTMAVIGFRVIDLMVIEGRSIADSQIFIGIAMFSGAAASLLAQWGPINFLRMSVAQLLLCGVAFSIVGVAITGVTTTFFGAAAGYAVVSVGIGFARPGFTAGASMALGSERQGAIAGVLMSISGMAFMLPPVIAVALYELHVTLPSILNTAFLAASALICWKGRTQLLGKGKQYGAGPIRSNTP